MTNEEFGRRIGVGHSMASRLRSGDRAPGPDTMRRICAEFQIPVREMLDCRALGPECTGELIRKRLEELDAGAAGASAQRDSVAA